MIGSSRSRYLRASRKCCLEPTIDNSGSCWPSSAMRSVERLPKPSRLDSCLLGRQIVGSQKCAIYKSFSRSRLSGVTKWVTNGVIWPLPSPYSGLRRRVDARRAEAAQRPRLSQRGAFKKRSPARSTQTRRGFLGGTGENRSSLDCPPTRPSNAAKAPSSVA